MRGRPLLELCLVGLLGLLLWIPLHRLTGTRHPSPLTLSPEAFSVEDRLQPVWLALRFSHAPDAFELFQGETRIGSGGAELRWDEDVDLYWEDSSLRLRITGAFPAEVESAYVELTVEPEQQPALRRGLWTRGSFSHSMEFRWSEN